jgi:hypothetical protein
MALVLGVKYCGHCQPHRNMAEFMDKLRPRLHGVQLVRWDDWGEYSHLLVLNACPVQCARTPEFSGPAIMIGSQYLNFKEYGQEEDLLAAAAELLNQMAAQNCARCKKDEL